MPGTWKLRSFDQMLASLAVDEKLAILRASSARAISIALVLSMTMSAPDAERRGGAVLPRSLTLPPCPPGRDVADRLSAGARRPLASRALPMPHRQPHVRC